MSTASLDYRPSSSNTGIYAQNADPMRDRAISRALLGIIVRDLVRTAQSADHKPEEARNSQCDSVRALLGQAYGSLLNNNSIPERSTILPVGASDSSISFEIHDTTLAHMLGTALEPSVSAVRGKREMADALTELAQYRWRRHNADQTAELMITDARLHGTCGCRTFADDQSVEKVARTSWVPVRDLILDPLCGGDLGRTRFRACYSHVLRSQLRGMLVGWGKDDSQADGAGAGDYDQNERTAIQNMQRELDSIKILDFYWRDRGYCRHIVMVDGIVDPVLDVDRWPYDLPDGRWPINVFRWNSLPDKTWGASDHRLTNLWEISVSEMQRFLLDSACISAKLVTAYDASVGSPDVIENVLGNLRVPYGLVKMQLQQISQSGLDITKLIVNLQSVTSVDKIESALVMAREIVSRTLGLTEMQMKLENPTIDPPRLARRQANWKRFLGDVLLAESCVDLTTISKQSLVSLHVDGNDPVTGRPVKVFDRMAYMPINDAESLERNQLPHCIRRGLTADQWDMTAIAEKKLRLNNGVDDESQVAIVEPGIARYVSRDLLVQFWEGTVPNVGRRVLSEYIFQVSIHGSLQASEAAMQRASGALGTIVPLLEGWGMKEDGYAWSDTYQKAYAQNDQLIKSGQRMQQLPQTPPMMRVLLAMLRDVVRSTGTDNWKQYDLRPEDLAGALARAKKMMDEQAAAQAQAAQPPPEDPQIQQMKIAELQLKVEHTKILRDTAAARLEVEKMQAATENLRYQGEAGKLALKTESELLKHQREVAEAPIRGMQQMMRAEAGKAQAEKAKAAASISLTQAYMAQLKQLQDAELTAAEIAKSQAQAELFRAQADKIDAGLQSTADIPPDTKQALEIAQAQQALAAANRENVQAEVLAKESEVVAHAAGADAILKDAQAQKHLADVELSKAKQESEAAGAKKDEAHAKQLAKQPAKPKQSDGGGKK